MNTAQALKYLRKRAKLTRAGVYKLIGTSPHTLYNWECGGVPIPVDRWRELCAAYGIDPGEALRLIDDPPLNSRGLSEGPTPAPPLR
jgi:transcriptional regulator with XRE-family HTH domain